MKAIILVVIGGYLVFLLCACKANRKVTTTPEIALKNCVLKLDSGINNIVLGVSNFDEIEASLGKGVRSKKKFKSFTVENIFPNTEHRLAYPEYGILFTTAPQNSLSNKKIIRELFLTKNCQCMTLGGIGIGSNYEQIANLLGESSLLFSKSANGLFTEVSYSFVEHPVSYVLFQSTGKKKKSEFIVEEVLLQSSYDF